MRISDWSSDVCSSDLLRGAVRRSNRQPSTMQDDSRRLLRSARNDAVRMRRGESPIKSRMTVNDRPQLTVCSRTYRSAKQKGRELPAPFVLFLVPRGSVALAGVGREDFPIFSFDARLFVGLGGAVLLGGIVRPFGPALVFHF